MRQSALMRDRVVVQTRNGSGTEVIRRIQTMPALSVIMIGGTSATSNLCKPMKSTDQYDPKRPPDDVFETPLMKMERQGRFLTIQTDRTPEQQAEIVTNIVNNRHKLLERAVEIRNELKDLLHRFTSLDLLAHQIAQDILQDPNSYQ